MLDHLTQLSFLTNLEKHTELLRQGSTCQDPLQAIRCCTRHPGCSHPRHSWPRVTCTGWVEGGSLTPACLCC